MKRKTSMIAALSLGLFAAGLTLFGPPTRPSRPEPISRLGVYRGYSERAYDGHERRSAYLSLRDGTRLAYLSEGILRASHRAQREPPFDNLGLPYRRHYEQDLAPIPAGEPVELVLDLLPTAARFAGGSRIRITIACADAGNFDTPQLDPAPELRLLRDAVHPSAVDLPVVSGQ